MNVEELSVEELEDLLRSGEAREDLRQHFGPALYEDMRRTATEMPRSADQSGTVFLLPGLMGSKLRVTRDGEDRRIWLRPLAIAWGGLQDMRWQLPGTSVDAYDAFHLAYLRMRLELRRAGFNAQYLPFDWRSGIDAAAADVATTIATAAPPVRLVAHSLGGMVARRLAADFDASHLSSVITMGTPNHGSYATPTVYRLAHDIVAYLALLDLTPGSTPTKLLTDIIRHYPAFMELFPSPDLRPDEPFFDLSAWPGGGVHPLKAALEEAGVARAALPMPDDRFTQIIGYGQETIDRAEFRASEMAFSSSRNGDGTVPVDLAETDGTPRYYVAEKHGRLPSNASVIRACKALLLGQVPDLETKPQSRATPGSRKFRADAELRKQGRSAIPRSIDPETFDPRVMLEPFLDAPSESDVDLPEPAAPETDFSRTYTYTFSQTHRRRINIDLVHGNLLDVGAETYVLGMFEGVMTLGGAAAAIDAELDGMLSRLVADGQISGRVGEVTFLPVGRHQLKTTNIAIVGLGRLTTDQDIVNAVEIAGRNIMRTLCIARNSSIATVLLAADSVAAENVPLVFQRLFAGLFDALVEWDGEESFSRIQFCELEKTRFDKVEHHLRDCLSRVDVSEVEIVYRRCQAEARFVAKRAAERRPAQRELFTALGELSADGRKMTLRIFHTAGSWVAGVDRPAAREPSEMVVNMKELEAMMAELQLCMSPEELQKLGARLEGMILDEDFRADLPWEALARNGLQIACDPWSSRIPWEALHANGQPVAIAGGVDRWYLPASDRVRRVSRLRRGEGAVAPRSVLLVADPDPDHPLPGAEREGNRLLKTFTGSGDRFTCIHRIAVPLTPDELAELLQGTQAGTEPQIFHYAGHAFFDPLDRRRSGLAMAGVGEAGDFLGSDLAALRHVPGFVFLNACESNRVRKAERGAVPLKDPPRMEQVDRSIGLAEAFLLSGVSHIIGTYWKVNDDLAARFGVDFYGLALKGTEIGQALATVRRQLHKTGSCGWINFIHYGNPHTRI